MTGEKRNEKEEIKNRYLQYWDSAMVHGTYSAGEHDINN